MIKQAPRVGSLDGPVSDPHPVLERVTVGFRHMLDDVANFVHLAALDECRIAGIVTDRCTNGFAAIDDVQTRRREVQTAFIQLS